MSPFHYSVRINGKVIYINLLLASSPSCCLRFCCGSKVVYGGHLGDLLRFLAIRFLMTRFSFLAKGRIESTPARVSSSIPENASSNSLSDYIVIVAMCSSTGINLDPARQVGQFRLCSIYFEGSP